MGTFSGNKELQEAKKVNKLCPGEQTVADAFGESRIERFVEEKHTDGTVTEKPWAGEEKYQWRMPFRPNDGHGRPTKDGSKVMELMSPYWKADSERQQGLQASVPRVALKDESGSVQYVPPEKAEETASRNGWHHHWRIKGVLRGVIRNGRYYRVIDGQLVEAV